MIKTQILLQKVKMQGQRIMFKCIKKEKKGHTTRLPILLTNSK